MHCKSRSPSLDRANRQPGFVRPRLTRVPAAIDSQALRMRRDTTTVLKLSSERAGLENTYSGSAFPRLGAELSARPGGPSRRFASTPRCFSTANNLSYEASFSGHAVDCTASRYDLTSPSTPQTTVDSQPPRRGAPPAAVADGRLSCRMPG